MDTDGRIAARIQDLLGLKRGDLAHKASPWIGLPGRGFEQLAPPSSVTPPGRGRPASQAKMLLVLCLKTPIHKRELGRGHRRSVMS